MQTVVCICHDRLMPTDEPISISITLSPTQVDEVVRAASRGRTPSISTLIANSLSAPLSLKDPQPPSQPPSDTPEEHLLGGYLPIDSVDPRLSRSLLRGLSILTCFGPDGGARGIVELAGELGMSPSTAHRYAATLVELGLLERCPKTRKYRLPER
jgi:IclR helix-turn-helix domain